jgi:hypothetical protein
MQTTTYWGANGSQHKGIDKGEIPEGLPGSKGHGMYVEKWTRTWETLSSPVDGSAFALQ